MTAQVGPLGLVALVACAGPADPPGAATLAGSRGTDTTGATDRGETETETDTQRALDLESPPDGSGCARVDLLFVIDDSHSMATEQGALVASFPAFMDDLYATLDDADSYHVGVITTDAYPFNDPPACQALGALVTHTGGANASAQACGPFASGRFLTDAEDLLGGFACAAQVGTEGSIDERPIEATLTALGPAHAADCNAGFVRDDALLVIVLITDEEDDHQQLLGVAHGSPGDPADWFAAVVERVGVEQNAVVLTIAGGHPDNVCGFPVGATAEDAPRLRAFTEMFTHAYLGDVCAGSFAPFFEAAVEVIDVACEGFTPVP